MRLTSVLFLVLWLAGCHHGIQTNEAVRQGVIDHLSKANLNVAALDITITSVEFNGNKADAAVTITAKGAGGGMPMSFKYHLEQQQNKWVYVGRDTGDAGHGNEAAPGADPHAGGMPAAGMPSGSGAANPHGGGAKMPSPGDLPPAKKK